MPPWNPATVTRRARARISRQMLRWLAPEIDASPADGGLGAHPLGDTPRPSWWHALPSDEALTATAMLAESDPAEATRRMERFLAADTPGTGAGWSDPGQVACRLIHMAAFHAWVNAPEPLSHAIAGSARAHAAWLLAEHPVDDADPDTALCYAALVIAGFAWPSLPGARSWRGPGLTGLSASLPAAIGEDGASRGEPARLVRALWGAALVRCWSEVAGAPLPAAAEGALLSGAEAMWRIGGDTGRLPAPPAPISQLLPLGPTPLAQTLRNLTLTWGLAHGAPAAVDDPAHALLTGSMLSGSPEQMAGDEWQLWTWRASHSAVAHRLIRKRPSRLWYSAAAQRMVWSLDGEALAIGTLPVGTLKVARVDGPQVTLIHLLENDGIRDIRLRQARLSVTDTGMREVTWQLPEGWALTPDDKGGYIGKQGRMTFIVKLGSEWRWTLDGSLLRGQGEGRVKYSFEIR